MTPRIDCLKSEWPPHMHSLKTGDPPLYSATPPPPLKFMNSPLVNYVRFDVVSRTDFNVGLFDWSVQGWPRKADTKRNQVKHAKGRTRWYMGAMVFLPVQTVCFLFLTRDKLFSSQKGKGKGRRRRKIFISGGTEFGETCRRHAILGGSGGMLPQKILNFRCLFLQSGVM